MAKFTEICVIAVDSSHTRLWAVLKGNFPVHITQKNELHSFCGHGVDPEEDHVYRLDSNGRVSF